MRQAIKAHLGSRQVSRVIYGAIIGLAVIVVLQAHPPSTVAVIATILGTAVAVGLAELYSEVLGTETRTRARIERERLRRILDDVFAVVLGISFPVVFFMLAAIGVLSLDSAFVIAKWTGLGLTVFYGFCGARLAGAGLLRSLLEGCAVGLIGALLILLKALVH